MKRGDFEHSVLTLWMTTQVPLTRANLQFYSGVERRQLDRWLDDMVKAGTVEFDSDESGEVLYTVPGADRPKDGPTNLAAAKKLDQLRRSLPKSTSLVKRAAAEVMLPSSSSGGGGNDQRSLIASGALSLIFGPLGWLYAAPIKDAVPGIALFLLLSAILPHFLWIPLLAILMPVSGIAGVAYAWLYNKQGQRTSLVDLAKNKQLPP